MTTPGLTNAREEATPPEPSLSQDLASFVRYWIHAAWKRVGKRRASILIGIAVAGAGIAFNWSWLAAIGVAPILLSLAPCAAMCALGLCMNKTGGKSCSTGQPSDKASRDITVPKTESDPT